MESVRKCLAVLARLTECGKAPVKNSRFDVVLEVTKALEEAISLADLPLSSEDPLPSTSHQDNSPEDPRIHLGGLLTAVYKELTQCLIACRKTTEDEFTVLSVQELALISSSLQFFVLAQLLPYIDEGVGLPISKRSAYVKSWTRLTTDVFQKEQLLSGLSLLRSLFSSNAALQAELLKSFLGDVICANEQLLNLGNPPLEWLEALFSSLPRTLFISTLLAFSKTYDRNRPPPLWFTSALGKRLSDILCTDDGLFQTLNAYVEMGGSQFWENSPLLSCFGRQLAMVPKGRKRMAYYENITAQFKRILSTGSVFPSAGVAELFSTFVDEMAKREPLACEVFVLDALFKPFETLTEGNGQKWNLAMGQAVALLSLFADDKICARAVAENTRLVELIPLLLGFLMSPCFDDPSLPLQIKTLSEDIARILKFLAKKVENIHDLLMSFVLTQGDGSFIISYKKSLISVVGEEDSDLEIKLQRLQMEDKEEMIMKKLDAVLKFIKMLPSSDSSCLLIEILCSSVRMWTESVSTAETPRFVAVNEGTSDPEWNRLASHLVALFCFEQLGEWDVDPGNPSVVQAIARLIQAVLGATVDWALSESADSRFFDVRSSSTEDEDRMASIRRTSAQMAVGLAAAVVAAGTSEVADSLPIISEALSLFIASAGDFHDAELQKTVEEAREVMLLLKLLGLKAHEPSTSTGVTSSHKKRTGGDVIADLRRDLEDEFVPVRGEALLRVAKAVRRREKVVLDQLEPWLYEKVREMVADPDSYVFLSAINTLAEVACYDSQKYLNDLLQLFLDLGKQTAPVPTEEAEIDSSILIMRGKLAEVIGKVFRCLGDVAPSWLHRAANIFLEALKDESDIIRASSLSAFSDLLLSCRGRALEKVIDELLFAVDLMVQNDKSELVRRAAVHLVRQCIKSCDRRILDVVGGRLRDLRRSLSRLWKWDRDHVVRLQAELCLEELGACLQSALEEETNAMFRIIPV